MSPWQLYVCSKRGRLCVGITTDLPNRMRQHGSAELLYAEGPFSQEDAGIRERQIKRWSRTKKLQLIEQWPSKQQ